MALLVNPSGQNPDGAISEKKSFILLGDVNGDGFITREDVNMIYNSLDTKVQVSLGNGNFEMRTQKATVVLTPEQKERADVDNDGIVTAQDAAIINQYISQKNQLPRLSPQLIELISTKNKIRLYEVHNYQDKNNRISNADTAQLVASGASDYDIISSLLVNESKAPVNIDIANVPKEEAIYQMLAGNAEKDLSFDLDKSGAITQNDYNIARGLEINTAIKETEENLKPKSEPITVTQIPDKTYQEPLEIKDPIKEVIMDAKTLPAETPIIEDGTFTSGSPTYPTGGGSLPGGGVPPLSEPIVPPSNQLPKDNLPMIDYTVPKELISIDEKVEATKATKTSENNYGLVIAVLLVLFLAFSE